MEGNVNREGQKKIGALSPVNIPIQMICGMDTTGSITPIRFRFQTDEDSIERIHIQKVVSRDEKNYVGIREIRFICMALFSGLQRIMEIRYSVESQKWRIFQFLS